MKEYFSVNENKLLNNYYELQVIEGFEIFKGNTGNIGQRGYVGSQGQQGMQGNRGYRGEIGDLGSSGDVGYKGNEGLPGIQGEQGMAGDDGPIGFDGNMGDKGSKGSRGSAGPDGEDGEIGIIGLKGYQGPQGVRGAMGNTPENNITIGDDENNTKLNLLTGEEINNGVPTINTTGNTIKDPINGQPMNPARKTEFNINEEIQCPWNGYLNGFTWTSDDNPNLNPFQIYENTEETIDSKSKTGKDLHTEDFNFKKMVKGLPYKYRVDCKVIHNN